MNLSFFLFTLNTPFNLFKNIHRSMLNVEKAYALFSCCSTLRQKETEEKKESEDSTLK